jgi:tetratricopeptide (TPR) repeat protein
LKIDPLSNRANSNLAVILFYMRDDHGTVEQCRKMLELDPQHWLPRLLAVHLLARQGRAEEAYRELDAITSLPRDHRLILRTRAEVSARLGRRDEAERALQALLQSKAAGRIPSSHIAIAYASLGQTDRAFDWLERAYAEYDAFLSLLHVYPAFDSLRSDPRYAALLTRLGLTEKTASGSTRIP